MRDRSNICLPDPVSDRLSGVVFRTAHGSHLYGLAHAGSDRDTFIVTFEDHGRARQTMNGDDDTVRVGWRTFLERAKSGSHQSVEALFSTQKLWTPDGRSLRPLIEGTLVTGGEVAEKYERTIKKFAHGDFKKRRHAARLALSLRGLRACGRFNPELTEEEKRWTRMMAEYSGSMLVRFLLV